MATSLYELSVGSYLQLLSATSGFMAKGLKYANDNKIDPNVIVETRLFPNMLPFRFQVQQLVHHSAYAMESLKSGVFANPTSIPQMDYATLQKIIEQAQATLQNMKAEDVDALESNEVVYQLGEVKLPFTAANFIMSFSLPNFYFHATTAYNILRATGVPIGKRDFVGMPRIKT